MGKKTEKKASIKKITDKDRLFLMELFADPKMSPRVAAKKVGYADSVAKTKAFLWVSNSQRNSKPQIKELYDKIMRQRNEQLEVNVQKIENELIKIAFSNITEIINTMGGEIDLEKLKNLTEYQAASILEISVITGDEGYESKKIKLHSKMRALELLGRRYKMFVDESEPVNYVVTIIDQIIKDQIKNK